MSCGGSSPHTIQSQRSLMFHKYRSKFFYTILNPVRILRYIFRGQIEQNAKRYLESNGVLACLNLGNEIEVIPVFTDLANMHRLVRARKPQTVLEFGSGFSTIVLAHALQMNQRERPNDAPPMLHSVESSEEWMDNTAAKIPAELKELVSMSHSKIVADELNGQLCFKFEKLPNVVPDFIYLDGPGAADVVGEVRGLSFQIGETHLRRQIVADVLLYESTFHKGAFILLDSMYPTMHFLRNHLTRSYKFRWNVISDQSSFELMEHGPKKLLPREFWVKKTRSS